MGIRSEEVKRLYDELRSGKAVAERLSCSERNVWKHLRKLNYHPQHGNRDRTRGQLAKWVKEHPEVKLPKSLKGIADLTGCSYRAIRTLYSRRRREALELAKKVSEHVKWSKNKDIVLKAEDNRMYSFRYVNGCRVYFDLWGFQFKVEGVLCTGKHVKFDLTKKAMEDLCRKQMEQ